MAQSKSSVINAPGESTAAQAIHWTTCDSNDNGTYFDMNGVAGDKAIILIAHLDSQRTQATSTGSTHWFLGSSGGSACSGASKENRFYSARSLGRMGLALISTADDKVSFSGSSNSAEITIICQ